MTSNETQAASFAAIPEQIKRTQFTRRQFFEVFLVTWVSGFAGCTSFGSNRPRTATGEQREPSDTPTAVSTGTREPGDGKSFSKLAAENGDPDDAFGWSASLSRDGNTALVGAPRDEDPNGERSGAAFVFERVDDEWRQHPKLAAEDGDSKDYFGRAIAIAGDGNTALVGAPRDDHGAGAAYVFERADDEWRQHAKLAAEDGDSMDFFGRAVAIAGDGNTALVGAPPDEDPNGDLAGSAYLFERADDEWRQHAKLTAEDGDPDDAFGGAVAIAGDGNTVLIAARRDEDPNGKGTGSTYAFERADDEWRQHAKLAGGSKDFFGWSVAIAGDGNTALVGAPHDGDPNGDGAGSAYLFERADDEWRQHAKLAAEDGDSKDFFGWSISLTGDGNTGLVSARGDEDPNGGGAGSAYVFR